MPSGPEEIERLIPHRAPFRFVDRIVDRTEASLTTEWRVPEDADFFRGHYPGAPLVPGVILLESVFQTGALLAALDPRDVLPAGAVPVLVKIGEARFRQKVLPGETLAIHVTLDERAGPARAMTGRVTSGGRNVLRVAFTVAIAAPEVAPVSDALGLAGRTILVTGVANKKSVAFHVSRQLRDAGATVIHVVRTRAMADELAKLIGPALVCDVERQAEIDALAAELARTGARLDGLVHSIAFANYGEGPKAFHETARRDFLQAVDVSCFSLVALAQALRPAFAPQASVVALSISDTRMAAESYGFMAPVKAALDSTIVFLAKSFSAFSQVRFNAVKAGPLKTSASAGIPGYLDNYLFAEAATLRHRALETDEVASAVLFLLSPRSSGVNAQGLLVDAGLSVNYFDREIVRRFARGASEGEA